MKTPAFARYFARWRSKIPRREALGLGPDRLDEGSGPEDPNRPLHVVCENVQAHLGSDLRKRFRQEVRRAHPTP